MTSTPTRPRRTDPLRKWGPLAAILVAIASVAVLVSVRAPLDDAASEAQLVPAPTAVGPTTVTSSSVDTDGVAPRPDGAVSFSQAQELGLDVTFPDTCDPETGRVAIPYFFAPECYADVADNGGATAPGVTGETITVVVYQRTEQDAVLDYVTSAINSDDTTAEQRATIEGYTQLFQSTYQTYGRSVDLKFLQASGTSNDEVAARADAVKAVEDLGAFAVWGGPALTSAWSEEVAARDVICIHCQAPPDGDSNVFATQPTLEQNGVILTEYLSTKLAGKPASFAGDESMHDRERVFGHIYIETGEHNAQAAARVQDALGEQGSGFAVQLGYTLDPARLQEQATSAISRLKDAGVTSVVLQSDPVAMGTFTREATAQRYHPEWVIGPSLLVDTAAFGRTYDQEQWKHAFGLSPRAAPVDRERVGTLYNWWFGEPAPADHTEATLSPMPAIFFAALQRAGPRLTTAALRDGLYAGEPIGGTVTAPSFSYGEHGLFPTLEGPDQGGIDNWTEIWWDPDEVGADELGRVGSGMYRYVDGAARYYPGELTDALDVFQEAGSVTVFTDLPLFEAERIGDYPPPR